MKAPKSKKFKLQKRLTEAEEIKLLESWIDFGKPDPGSNPLSFPSLPSNAPIGKIDEKTYSQYTGCKKFNQLPLSQKTKDGLSAAKYTKMTDIQRASLPHSLAGRDIRGAAKTGSGKTLAFIIPVLEKLYKQRWGPQDGVGAIIISPTRELASQLFEVLKSVGKYHGFSAGLLIGGRKDVDMEKEHVNDLNILVCTPGRLLQHMDETPNFECSQLQVLVLDEADRILDLGFKKAVDAIVSQLPKRRQTFLFSATQTKSSKHLERLSMKDPEYISVHEEAETATPSRLHQTAMIVPLDQKLNMLWSFVRAHLNSRILVFLSTCKQVKFVFEAFKKLRPGIPLKCLHGRMKQESRMGIYTQFCENRSVLFSTDVASRGLDFDKVVDWVVQVDCPDDVASYIHRVGRTARYLSAGRSVLFLLPTEMKMLEKLEEKKIPVQFIKANTKRLQLVSGLLAALLVKYKDLQYLAQRAFITYLRSIYKQRDKEVFDVMKLPIDEFSASMGLPMTPKIRFLNLKSKGAKEQEEPKEREDPSFPLEVPRGENLSKLRSVDKSDGDEEEDDFLVRKQSPNIDNVKEDNPGNAMSVTRIGKKKKLKINIHRPAGTRVVFDEEGNTLPPFATIADMGGSGSPVIDREKVNKRFAEMREEMKMHDKEDKFLDRQRLKEKRMKAKNKLKRAADEDDADDDDDDDLSESDRATNGQKASKNSKKYFGSDDDENKEGMDNIGFPADSISVAQQEELALKLLSSMNS